MSLILVIDTFSRPFNIALGLDRECLFDSLVTPGVADGSDLSAVVAEAFREAGRSIRNIRGIAVNIGPGALGSVRSGVSFANALAYSLGVPVYPFTAFELMGLAASEQHDCPILCSARASNGYAYVGVYRENQVSFMAFGLLSELAPAAIDDIERVAVAGAQRSEVCALLGSDRAIDSGVERSTAATFLRLDTTRDRDTKVFPEVASPITEDSELLIDPTKVCRGAD